MSFGSSSPKVSQVSTMDQGQKSIMGVMEQILMGNFPYASGDVGVGYGVPSYPGTYTAGPSALQSQAFSGVSDLMSGQGFLQPQTMSGLESLLQPWDPSQATKTWQQSVQGPAMANWEQNISPQIMEQFAGYDAASSGGSRRALAESGQNLQTGLSSSLGNWLQTGQQNAAQNLLGASSQAQNLQLNDILTGLQAGGTQRGVTSEQLLEPYQKWLQEQSYNNPWLQYLMPILNTKTFENVVTPGTSSGIGGMLGEAGSLFSGIGDLAGLFL